MQTAKIPGVGVDRVVEAEELVHVLQARVAVPPLPRVPQIAGELRLALLGLGLPRPRGGRRGGARRLGVR